MGVVFACGALGTTAFAGTETYSGKEMKQVAPAPPPMCEWGGFYVGLHAGGQFGHSETAESFTVEGLGMETGPKFGYSESGFNGGGQFGYNWQWNWLVLGPEFDVGEVRPLPGFTAKRTAISTPHCAGALGWRWIGMVAGSSTAPAARLVRITRPASILIRSILMRERVISIGAIQSAAASSAN